MAQCTDEQLAELVGLVQNDATNGLAYAERAIELFPDDARVHFLRGSLLAGAKRPIEAHASLSRAVALAPDFAIARFQLGFFELTSGEPARAQATWEPLRTQLPDDHYLRHFVAGLCDLIADRFRACIEQLETGIALNQENPPLNNDMRLIIDQCRPLADGGKRGTEAGEETPQEETSATSLLLGQLGGRGTMH